MLALRRVYIRVSQPTDGVASDLAAQFSLAARLLAAHELVSGRLAGVELIVPCCHTGPVPGEVEIA